MAQEQKKVSAKELKELVEAGWKKPEIAKHFEIPVMRVGQYLTQLGLRIKSTRNGGSILEMDLEEENPNQMEIEFPAIPNNVEAISENNDQENTHNVESITETQEESVVQNEVEVSNSL